MSSSATNDGTQAARSANPDTRADDLGWSDWGTPEAIEESFAAMGVVPPWQGRVEAA